MFSMKHSMKLSQPYYDLIKKKQKNVEIRLLDQKRKLLKNGDQIMFTNKDNEKKKFVRRIINIKKHKNFELAIKKATLKESMPNCKTIQEAVNIYNQIYGNKINNFKVLAIYLKN